MENNTWTCPRCCMTNSNTRDICSTCGQKKHYSKDDPIGHVESMENKKQIYKNGISTIIIPSKYKADIFDLKKQKSYLIRKLVISKKEINCYDSKENSILSFSISENDRIEHIENMFIIRVPNNEYTVTIKSISSNEENINIDNFAKEVMDKFNGYITIEGKLNEEKSERNGKAIIVASVLTYLIQLVFFFIAKANITNTYKEEIIGMIKIGKMIGPDTVVSHSAVAQGAGVFSFVMMIVCIIALFIIWGISGKIGEGEHSWLSGLFAALTAIGMLIIAFY